MQRDIEKRRHHRQRAGLQVTVLPGDGGRSPAGLKLVTSDVALKGMLCASNMPLEQGTELRLRLTLVGGDLAGSETIDVTGRVLRCFVREGSPDVRRHGVALEFVRIDPGDSRKLQNYLNSL